MNDIDQRVREHYDSLSMPKDKIDQLLKQTSLHAESDDASHIDHDQNNALGSKRVSFLARMAQANWKQRSGLTAGFACVLLLMVSLWAHNSGSESEQMLRTVREVAMNHTTRLEPEYRGETLAMLDNSMQQLPFALTLPESINNAYELIGSRYCSLGGVLAAHVRLKDTGTGKPMSLFVTSNSDELEEIRSQQTTIEGVDVEFWREGGLFYALAQRS